jgi:AmmeMemoRadiSam system protein B/AmmeMemoRadiSam system protein A
MGRVHYSPYAGSWYPGDAGELREGIARALEDSRRRAGPWLFPNPVAFVVPHAGLMYSGTVAAAVYRYLHACRPRRVVILGFSHDGGPPGLAMPDVDALATPLGITPVDRAAADRLHLRRAAVCDHSVEMQLPLLQYVAPAASVLPVYVGRMTAAQRESAARVLAGLAGEDTAWLASSDLTHRGPRFGFEPAIPVEELDRAVIDDAASLDPRLFLEGLDATGATVCGRAPIALLLQLLGELPCEEIFQQTLDYQTSAEIAGDDRDSVSYGALGFFPASSFELAAADGACLMGQARAALASFGGTRRDPPPPTPPLTRRAGAFVTLRQAGELRGCVGSPEGRGTLAQTVAEMTISAARDDPRFPPLSPCAARSAEIEISVLSPLKRIRAREAFRPGEHGVHLDASGCRSLLLPHVATERGWTPLEFWGALARKAGLTEAVYENPTTRLHIFRAQQISM